MIFDNIRGATHIPSTTENIKDESIRYLRHTSAADREAFDDLYNRIQEIKEITNRAIREGQRGHKSAIEKIRTICQGIE